MTPDQYRDTLATRRAEIEAERETIRLEREDLDARDAVLVVQYNELTWALVKYDAEAAPKPIAPVAPAPKIPALDQCIGAIVTENIDVSESSDRTVKDELKSRGHRFAIGVVRRAMAAINKPSPESRAAETSQSDHATERDARMAEPLSLAPNSGAGNPFDEAAE